MHLVRSKSPYVLLRVAVGIVALLAALPHAAAAVTMPDAQRAGVPFMGSMGIRRTTADVMQQEAASPAEPTVPTLMNEHEFVKPSSTRANPAAPRVASIPPMPADQLVYKPKRLPNQVMAPQSLGVNFTAATLATTGSFPPDCDGAIGPTQYVVAVNGRITSFNKTTGIADGVLNTTTNTFFTSVRNASGTSDPMVRYDRLSNRWFISIINVSTPNRWLLAVSDAASNGIISAGTVWTYYFFVPATTSPSISNGSTCLSDYPSLGVDAKALYMGVSEFCGSGQPFQQTDVFVIRKASVLSGGPIVVTAFRALMTASGGYVGPWSARGVDNYDPNANEGYFLSADGATWGGMILNRIADPGGTPSISANLTIAAPAGAGPRPVPHPSNSGGYWGRLDPLDDRYFSVHIRNQQLWAANNLGVNNTGVSTDVYTSDTRVGSRWYQVNVPVNTGTPTIVQSGTVFASSASNDSLQKSYFIPSIMVSGQGHVAMAMTTAGETNNANIETVGRLAGDPAGTMQAPLAITTNTNTYNPASDPGGISAGRPRRWGDYSITALDPTDDMSMWTVQEFCDANNSYGVRVTRLIAPAPATPASLPDVPNMQASVTVTLTGTSVSGSGFYDPGPDLASPARPFSHLTATVTNGSATGTPPSVISATYIDPTHVQLVLNTTTATANVGAEKYTVTITNPDGQSVAAAVVHVVQSNFTITATAGAGGSITPSGAVTVAPGANQSFTIAADGCHTLADVVVDGSSVGAVTSYTFTNVQANHTIAASFASIPYTITASAGAGGSISPSGNVTVNCGNNQSFTISPAACFHIDDVLVDGGSVGAVASYTFTNVTTNHTIAASFAAGVPAPGPVTGLAAAQVKTGNGSSGTTKTTLTFTAPGGTTVEVWRKGFGGYPQYTGSAPPAPSYPPAGWTLTTVTASGQTDQAATRDFWYYVAFAKDGCGNTSVASNVSAGNLGYHLGDVSDGATAGQGDNVVNTADVSLLGTHYGATGAALAPFAYLDIGPTTSGTTNGRPTPDGIVEFEDLVLLAVNYTPHVSVVSKGAPRARATAAKAAVDVVSADGPATVTAGEEFEVPVHLAASGDLLALSVSLGWNTAVVRPASVSSGELVDQAGGVVLSPAPGRADATLLGAGSAMSGEGTVARVRFQAIADGAPGIGIARAIGRDDANHAVSVAVQHPLAASSVALRTGLAPVRPNPTSGGSELVYSLAARGAVDLSVYSIDGRRVTTLAHGEQGPGRFQVAWDGRDDHGSVMRSGVYIIKLEAAGTKQSRLLTVIR